MAEIPEHLVERSISRRSFLTALGAHSAANAPKEVPIPFEVKQYGQMPVVSYIPAYMWRCDICGWQGTGWGSESGAAKEGADHVWNDHKVIPCRKGQYGGPHVWKHVPKSDSLSKCERCEWVIGK